MASNSVKDSELNESQSFESPPENDGVPLDENFLMHLEELAKNRYTDEDEDYKRVKEKPQSTPPILEGYTPRNSNRGNNRYQNRGPYRERNERYQRYDEPRHHPSSSNNYHRDRSSERSYYNR